MNEFEYSTLSGFLGSQGWEQCDTHYCLKSKPEGIDVEAWRLDYDAAGVSIAVVLWLSPNQTLREIIDSLKKHVELNDCSTTERAFAPIIERFGKETP